MPNAFFKFKQFTVHQDKCAMKVTTDACLFGAWCSMELSKGNLDIKNILDVGTGTGLLSLMLAQKNNVLIDAVEIDNDAADQASENVHASPFNERIEIILANILALNLHKLYDAIICNPPFYEEELQSPNPQKNTAHHSTQLKLPELLEKVNGLLRSNGMLFLLLPYKRKIEVETVLNKHGLYTHKSVTVKQTETHSSFRIMIVAKKTAAVELQEQQITIKKNDSYTAEFVALLKDYYLYL